MICNLEEILTENLDLSHSFFLVVNFNNLIVIRYSVILVRIFLNTLYISNNNNQGGLYVNKHLKKTYCIFKEV